MKKQLTGIAWILFGMLPVLTGIGEGIELIPLLDDIPKDFWVLAGLACGVFGLITAARNSGE